MRSKILLMTLAIATPALMSAGLLDTTVTIGIPTIDDYFFYIECSTTTTPPCSQNFGPIHHGKPVPPVTDYQILNTVPGSIVSGYLTVLGLDAATGTHVVAGLASSVNIANDPWPFATPEATIITDLQTADTADLSVFFSTPANLPDWVAYSAGTNTTGNFGEFSNGVVVGSLSVSLTAVPEPGTLALLGCGLAALIFVRRKPEFRRKPGS